MNRRGETYGRRRGATRVGLWLVLAAAGFLATVQSGCREKVKKGLTGVRLTVVHSGQPPIQQVLVSGLVNGQPAFEPTAFPSAAGEPISGEMTLVILLPHSTGGETLILRVDGLFEGGIVATGQELVGLVRGQLVDVTVELGQAAICGDSEMRQGIETCDDGNNTSGDGCSDWCLIEHGYYCDGEPSDCVTQCGDGMIAGLEECDDENRNDADGCSSACTLEPGFDCAGEPSVCTPLCGDGLIRGNEECDDDNQDDADGCASDCRLELGWECTGEPSTCSGVCGDGLIRGAEECDDENQGDGDGCSAICRQEDGWDCSGEPSACVTLCGDGLVRGGEECDDNNLGGNDGCAPDCTVEPGYVCQNPPNGPSVCRLHCTSHAHCAYICDDTAGTCVDEADIVFVWCGGLCPGSGTVADPYCTLEAGVNAAAAGAGFVYVEPGFCDEAFGISSSDIVIVGEPGAVLRSPNCPTLQIWGANVTVDGLGVMGVFSGNYQGGGIRVDNGGTLSLLRMGQIGPSGCLGILCDGSICMIHGNVVTGNSGGGIDIDGSTYSITNNIIIENGTNGGNWGGVRLQTQVMPIMDFINNTVADNLASSSPGSAGGVYCTNAAAVVNSILWQNGGDEVTAQCAVSYSAVDQTGFDGVNGNIEQPPDFLAPAGDNYHIQPTSPCVDTADQAQAPPSDIDGDSRPLGNGVDMGADEAG